MQIPKFPPRLNVPDLYDLAEDIRTGTTNQQPCSQCGHVDMFESSPDWLLASFIRQLAEFYDANRPA